MPMKTRTPSLRTQKGESIPSIRLNTSTKDSLEALLREVRACKICSTNLPLGPRPVLQCHASARILIVGQAPGRKVHESGIPFQDASGERLRSWLGITSEIFYDERRVAILPMGFCFPGTGVSGDLPPRPDCAPAWRNELLKHLSHWTVCSRLPSPQCRLIGDGGSSVLAHAPAKRHSTSSSKPEEQSMACTKPLVRSRAIACTKETCRPLTQ